MDMAHAVHILLQHLQGIFAGEGEVAGVVAQVDIARIGVGQHPVGLGSGLDNGAHVVMEAQLKAAIRSHLTQAVQAVAETIPLLVGHDGLVVTGQNGHIGLALDGAGLLADIDAVGTNGFQEIQFLDELGFHFLVGLVHQEGGEPAAGDAHAAQIQFPLQFGSIGRILVADLAAGEAGQCHFADDLAEGVFAAQFGHIIVAPADGGDAKLDFFFVKHFVYSSFNLGSVEPP